jgi:DNA (cytosine-5)-methyltransferase 1
MNEFDILTKLLKKAISNIEKKTKCKHHIFIISNIDIIMIEVDKNKSLVSALVTSLLKKTISPDQDIRLHRADFVGGYSARVLDTNVTTPFFKKHFPRYANKESGFLSMATRAQIPWTKDDHDRIRTRASKKFMLSFVGILDAVEKKKIDPSDTIIYLFEKLYDLSKKQQFISEELITTSEMVGVLNIDVVLTMLKSHLSTTERGTSRLPVVALYTIYQLLSQNVDAYKSMALKPLNVHTASDKHSLGDIEVYNPDDTPYEIVEVKHNISINRGHIFDVIKKAENRNICKYYILTTANDNFSSSDEEVFIQNYVLKIKK